jgi:Cupin domain/Carboxypeptidase regulatory-like domain
VTRWFVKTAELPEIRDTRPRTDLAWVRRMKWTNVIPAVMAGVAIGTVGLAPTRAAQAPPKPAPAQKPAAAAPRTASVRIAVKDPEGTILSGVRLQLSGAAEGDFVTGGAGTVVVPNLKDGVYRVRCEREGFITLEREFTVRGGAYNQMDVVLNPAPPPPPPIVDYLDHNLIGREPLKESVLACNPLETVRLLQLREGIAQHVHQGSDEMIYVVAGEGSVHIGEATTPLRSGSLVVVTNGTGHALDRSGKNPLIVVSTLIGEPCDRADTPR